MGPPEVRCSNGVTSRGRIRIGGGSGQGGRGAQGRSAPLADEVVRQSEDSPGDVPVLSDGGVGGELGKHDVEELPRTLVDDEGVESELAVPALRDEADAPERGEVLGSRGPGDVEDRRDLADAELTAFERGEDSESRAIREDLGDIEEAGKG